MNPANECLAKRRYLTNQAAAQGLATVLKRNGEDENNYSVYRCSQCHYWHFGHAGQTRQSATAKAEGEASR